MLYLIGSMAVFLREPKFFESYEGRFSDIDIIGTMDEVSEYAYMTKQHIQRDFFEARPFKNGEKYVYKFEDFEVYKAIEAEIAWEGSNIEWLIRLMEEHEDDVMLSEDYKVAPMHVLYMLKMSHRFLKNSPHFEKTRRDILRFRELGYDEIDPRYEEWYKDRVKKTYWYEHPNLNRSKKEFFSDDGVGYVYDHDTIHEAVKLFDKPAYSYFKPDENEVMTSKKMFLECDFNVQLAAVMEESCVLAIERSIVPHPGALTDEAAFRLALTKVCTSITSGWFRDFAWENFDKALENYPKNYTELFRQGVENGTVKEMKETA